MSTLINGEYHLTRIETGVALVMALENRGAVFIVLPDGHFRAHLDRCDRIADDADANALARIILEFRHEVRLYLHTRRHLYTRRDDVVH
jgi:hypothetical protein